jgi:hypothetical protein
MVSWHCHRNSWPEARAPNLANAIMIPPAAADLAAPQCGDEVVALGLASTV